MDARAAAIRLRKSMNYQRYWERNGARRPFPPLYEAAKAYGDGIYFPVPSYVKPGFCKWCGSPIIKGRKAYCCNECRDAFRKKTVWGRTRDAYSLRILYRDNFTCQDCGEFHAYKNKHGIFLPIDDGQLHVHHIVSVAFGGGDEPSNLITLCVDCHLKRHRKKENKDNAKMD